MTKKDTRQPSTIAMEQWARTKAAKALGSIKSEKKATSSRENGKKGGRPVNKEKILDAFSKIELFACSTCGALIGKKEYEAGEKSCFKCWGN